MNQASTLASLDRFLLRYADIVRVLYEEAQCARWGVLQEAFAECLRRSAEKRFAGAQPGPGEVEAYLRSLHLQDLALACACGEGIEKAWEFFIAHFRQDLRRAAGAMMRGSGQGDDARAEELADSLYAELYGVRSASEGRRKSLFEYFHGRSKLSTWLRAVMAQKQVDLLRTTGKTVSLEAETEKEGARELPQPRSKCCHRTRRRSPSAKISWQIRRGPSGGADGTGGSRTVDSGVLLRGPNYPGGDRAPAARSTNRPFLGTLSGCDVPCVKMWRRRCCAKLPRGTGARPSRLSTGRKWSWHFEYAVEDWPFDLSQALSAAERPGPAGKMTRESLGLVRGRLVQDF